MSLCQSVRLPERQDISGPRYQNVMMSECHDVRVSQCQSVTMSESQDARVPNWQCQMSCHDIIIWSVSWQSEVKMLLSNIED